MMMKKTVSNVDRVVDELQSLRNIIGGRSFNGELTGTLKDLISRFDSLDKRFIAIDRHLDSTKNNLKGTLRIVTRFFDFIFNVVFMMLGVFIGIMLAHVH